MLSLKVAILLATLFSNGSAKIRKFRRDAVDFSDSVAFGREAVALFNDNDAESILMTTRPLVGLGQNKKLKIETYVHPRLFANNNKKPQIGVVLFFAPPEATLDDVSHDDNQWGKFEESTVGHVRDVTYKNGNSTMELVSHVGWKETPFSKVADAGFSFSNGGYFSLTRKGGRLESAISQDGVTWNITSSIYLPKQYKFSDLKAGIRIKRENRKKYIASLDAKYQFKNYAAPIDDDPDDDEVDNDEIQVFDISIDVLGLCSDTSEGLAAKTKTDLEWVLLEFFKNAYGDGFQIDFQSVMILDDFEDGDYCENVEDNALRIKDDEVSQQRRQLKGSIFSSLWFILTGFCFGSCPTDPSDAIDTTNRRLLQGSASDLEQRLQTVVPDVQDVKKKRSRRLDCELSENCNAADGRCCGYSDACFCRHTKVTLCKDQSSESCHPAFLPKCTYDITCDRTVDITPDRQTLVLGASHEAKDPPNFFVYDHQSESNKWYLRSGNDIDADVDHNDEDRRLYGSSVSIADDGNRVALGGFATDKVKIVEWDANDEIWQEIISFEGSKKTMFGYSVSYFDNGVNNPILAIGAPKNETSSNCCDDGVVYSYIKNQNEWQSLPPITGSACTENFGWRVNISSQNQISAGYRRTPEVLSFRLENNNFIPIDIHDSLLKQCFAETVGTCEDVLDSTYKQEWNLK